MNFLYLRDPAVLLIVVLHDLVQFCLEVNKNALLGVCVFLHKDGDDAFCLLEGVIVFKILFGEVLVDLPVHQLGERGYF